MMITIVVELVKILFTRHVIALLHYRYYIMYTFFHDTAMLFSICVRASACLIVCRLKTDRYTRRGPSGDVWAVVDIFLSCNVFLAWHQNSFANGVSSSGSAWLLPWVFLRPCRLSHSRSNSPSVSRSQISEI